MSYADFFKRVAAELGVAISIAPPPADPSALPLPLHDFYSFTDGLRLPFAEFHTADVVRTNAAAARFGAQWIEFGFDGTFTRYLVSTKVDDPLPIAAFDPEAEPRPEGAYPSVLELLEDEYSRHVENEFSSGDLHVAEIPDSTPMARIVHVLKRVSPLSSVELLRELREAPLVLTGVNAPAGIAAVRKLHALGVAAYLKNVGPERAG